MNTTSGELSWRKSSYSTGAGGQCVEVAAATRAALVRDTADRQGPMLTVGAAAWTQFLATIR